MTAKKEKPRNYVLIALNKRHAHTQTHMKDRRQRRAKDARKSWKNEDWNH
jgi:hypothetical protein